MSASPDATVRSPAVDFPEVPYAQLSPGPGLSVDEVKAHQCARIHSAVVELVGDGGYEALALRKVVRIAGVSTRTFYEHFEGKEECFLRTYELIVQRVAQQVAASLSSEGSWPERLSLAIGTLARAVVGEPRSARLALIEVSAAGPAALAQMHVTEALFEAMLEEGFAHASDGVRLPPVLATGIVSGLANVVQSRLLTGREQDLPSMVGELTSWALSFQDKNILEIEELEAWKTSLKLPPRPGVSDMSLDGVRFSHSDRHLILTATAKLAASNGYGQLTASRIRIAAGVSRRSFDACFESAEDCFLHALDLRVTAALKLGTDYAQGRGWSDKVCLVLQALCSQLEADPVLSTIALSEVFVAGRPALRYRENMTADLAKRLRINAPPDQIFSPVAAEASVGAVWAVLRFCVGSGQQQFPRLAALLTYLLLAPSMGASHAVDVIRDQKPSAPPVIKQSTGKLDR